MAGKSAQLLGAPPQTPVFGGEGGGGFAPLTPTRSSVPGPSWGLSPQTPSVLLFSLLEVATLASSCTAADFLSTAADYLNVSVRPMISLCDLTAAAVKIHSACSRLQSSIAVISEV